MKAEKPGMNKEEKKILVTGAAGLVGKEVVKQLVKEGKKVKAIFHSTPVEISHPNLEAFACDILDVIHLQELMQDVSNVYHTAAVVSYSPKDKQLLLKTNVEGTANVVNACIHSGVEKLIHVSSVSALGRIRENGMVTEKMNWTEETSNSIYGKSKYYGEMEVWRGMAEGLKAAIVNPSLILGGDNWESSSSVIFKNAYKGFKWYTDGVSGFVDVRDVARAMIFLMESDISNERFILNGENLPFKDVFTMIAECFGKRPPYKKASPLLGELLWRLESFRTSFTGASPLLTKETVRTARAKVYFDNSKILEALPGFHFTPIAETIAYTCENLKKKNSL